MKRQNVRRLLITIAMLLFPVTLYYFSPALIINAGLSRVINGSFIVFLMLFALSIPFGRFFCAYLCPAGGLQECTFSVTSKSPKQGWKNNIKYIIWVVWIAAVIFCYFYADAPLTVDFFFETESGISVSSPQSYIIYYGIVFLIFVPSILFGKRVFCHYFCWMAPFMVAGIKVQRLLRLPGLHIVVVKKEQCISCKKCNRACPMCLDVNGMVEQGRIGSTECIQCGGCIDDCPKGVLRYGMRERRGR